MGLVWFLLFLSLIFIGIPFCLRSLRKWDLLYRLNEWLADWLPLLLNRIGLWVVLTAVFIVPALLLGSTLAYASVSRVLLEADSLISVISWTFLRGTLLLPPTVFIIAITFIKTSLNDDRQRYKSNVTSAFIVFAIYSAIEIVIVTSVLATYDITIRDIQTTQEAILATVVLNIPWLIVWWYLPDPIMNEGVLVHD
ncbi:MAG: hypothetical protein AAF846_16870 [Chloroflexota bacterium]